MKKEREEIIKKMYEDVRQIPGYITGCGAASATIESYIAAAKDLQQAHEYEMMILGNIFQCEECDRILKLPDVDKADFFLKDFINQTTFMRDRCRELYTENSRLLHEFIEERRRQGWK